MSRGSAPRIPAFGKEVAIPAACAGPSVTGPSDRRNLLKRATANIVAFVFDDQAEATLSERVRCRIDQQQAASEIIIGWIQACAVVLFAAVYAISPKAFPPGTHFEPIPWTLALYAVFTAVRIVLAYRGRLSNSLVAISTVVDIAVLMITIWSFHLQYQAPPALHLKAPTLMYVFILVALRTLRFEPRYVLIAGGCGAAGWLTLFIFAAAESAADIHRDASSTHDQGPTQIEAQCDQNGRGKQVQHGAHSGSFEGP